MGECVEEGGEGRKESEELEEDNGDSTCEIGVITD